MPKNKKHLEFYMKHAESGKLSGIGSFLCSPPDTALGLCRVAAFGEIDRFLLASFEPTDEDDKWLQWEEHNRIFWGSDCSGGKLGIFTPLRQTIVLFMAAMNDEL